MAGPLTQTAGPSTASCPVCGGARLARALTAQDLNWKTPGAFPYERCKDCGILFRPIGPVHPAASYPFGYGSYPDPKGVSLSLHIDTAANRRRATLLDSVGPPGTILDVGCGSGFFLAHMWSRGWRVRGIDMAREHVAFARNVLGLPDVSADVWPPERGDFRDFDAVGMIHLIEHLADPIRALAAARDALRKGGSLLLETPNVDSWPARLFGSRWVTLDAPRHLILFNPKSLSSCLRRAGFEVIRAITYSPSTMEWSESLRYALIRPKRIGQGHIPSTTITSCASMMHKQGDREIKQILMNPIHTTERLFYRLINAIADRTNRGCNILIIAFKK